MFQVYDDLLFKPAWPLLFAIASGLEYDDSLTLGPGVVNPYHMHPSLIATHLACLNEESKGRAFLMIGRGAFHDLFDVKSRMPLTTVKEGIKVIHNVLSGKTEDFAGRVFSYRGEAQLRWRRRSRLPMPPIWIGTWGAKMCALAGSMMEVSGVMISSITDPKYIQQLKDRIEAGAKSVGRAPSSIEVGCVPGTIVSKDRDQAQQLAREASAVYLPYLAPMTDFEGVSKEEVLAVREALSRRDVRLATTRVSDKAVDAFKLWGTPEDLIEKTAKLLDNGKGVDRINYGFGRGKEDLQGIKLLGEHVLPYFRATQR